MSYIALAKLHQLYDGFCEPVQIAGRQLLLLQEEGRHYLIANRCPHLGAPLTNAGFSHGVLRCPVHGLEFALANGRCLTPGACATGLVYYPLVYEGNTLGVEL